MNKDSDAFRAKLHVPFRSDFVGILFGNYEELPFNKVNVIKLSRLLVVQFSD